MLRDERRSARLLFADELGSGTVDDAAVQTREVLQAVSSRPVPSRFSRRYQQNLLKRGTLDAWDDIAALDAARRSVLGDAAAGPPKLLVRVDGVPHAQARDDPQRFGTAAFRRFHAVMRRAGIPYLAAVLPTVPRDHLTPSDAPGEPLAPDEVELLADLRRDGVAFALHGLDHRTRDRRHHAELVGLDEEALAARLDAGQAILREHALSADVLVPPFNRFEHRHWPELSRRFDVVTGGPESVGHMGWHRSPLWRGNAVYFPSHHPFDGRAGEVRAAVERLTAERRAVWVCLTLHWSREQEDDFAELEALCSVLAGAVQPWDRFLEDVRRSGRE